MNLNEECLLQYLQNPDELVDLTSVLVEINAVLNKKSLECNYGKN